MNWLAKHGRLIGELGALATGVWTRFAPVANAPDFLVFPPSGSFPDFFVKGGIQKMQSFFSRKHHIFALSGKPNRPGSLRQRKIGEFSC
jgi:hypothetical protein